jgi:hypothetical protein
MRSLGVFLLSACLAACGETSSQADALVPPASIAEQVLGLHLLSPDGAQLSVLSSDMPPDQNETLDPKNFPL